MTTPYENILAALTTYAPADRVEELVRDLDAMRASAREEVLDEVAEALESYGSYMISMPVVRKYLDTLRDQRPADPELARLEREVARAAVAWAREGAAHEITPADHSLYTAQLAGWDRLRSRLGDLQRHIVESAKREGGAK